MPKLNTLCRKFAGWGRYPVAICESVRPESYQDLRADAAQQIARGQGRSYGDAALGARLILTERVNRLLAFDALTGVLRAEAGVTLAEILVVIVPQGWFLPVTPGTQWASLGGCVATDVHGKNHHHDGSFARYVVELELILADASRVICSSSQNASLFWATVGGMGLTGIIGEVTLQLIPVSSPYLQVRHYAASNLAAIFAMFADPGLDDKYSVAWIDCLATGERLGRSVLMCANHAAHDSLPPTLQQPPAVKRARSMAFDLPAMVLNPYAVKLFNAVYYYRQGHKNSPFFAHYREYFYPLDRISEWNHLYGKRGFVQYQCVLPEHGAYDAVTALLQALTKSRRASFLAVLKRLGVQNSGLLSFPMAGYTLALDIPMRDAGVFALVRSLDEIVLQYGGRIYLAKDALLTPQMFRVMYPRYREWLAIKREIDPMLRFQSGLGQRLALGYD